MKQLLILSLLFFSQEGWAVCGGSSPTWTAASASQTDVEDCITAASEGDTINVPSGTPTWSTITITKGLSIIGAGIGNTVVTCSTCFDTGQGIDNIRVSGFEFGDGASSWMISINGANWRVDNCDFTMTADGEAVNAWSNTSGMFPYGLFDNNVVDGGGVLVNGSLENLADKNHQHVIWAQDPDFGGRAAVYIEDNTFTVTHGDTTNVADSNRGGRYVLRFNSITDNYVEAHGVQGYNRAAQRWEIYNNDWNSNPFFWMFLRGGSGYVFDNTFDAVGNNIRINTQRSCEAVSTAGRCGASSVWDENTTSEEGYACRDQIGRSKDNTLWDEASSYDMDLTPAYIFFNQFSGTELAVVLHQDPACDRAGDFHMIDDRDFYTYDAGFDGTSGVGRGTFANRPSTCTTGVAYWATDVFEWNSDQAGKDGALYRCASTNTWQLHYIPYSYPHPMRAGDVAGLSATGTITDSD